MRKALIIFLLIIACSYAEKHESDMEIMIYNSFLEYLQSKHEGEIFVLSPMSSLGVSDMDINVFFVQDSAGNIIEHHWITEVYKSWSKFSDSLNFFDLKNNYMLVNKSPIFINKYFESISLDTLSLKNYKAIFRTGVDLKSQWISFNLKHPKTDGYLLISRPGISSDKKWSIIYYEKHHNAVGGGYFVLLKNIGYKWEVVESILSWGT